MSTLAPPTPCDYGCRPNLCGTRYVHIRSGSLHVGALGDYKVDREPIGHWDDPPGSQFYGGSWSVLCRCEGNFTLHVNGRPRHPTTP